MTCDSHEWLDHDTIDDAVEESPFKRNQIQSATHAVWRQHLEIPASFRWPLAHRAFNSVQIMKDVRRAQELQQSKAGVSGKMNERDRGPANRDFHDDDPHLRQGCVGER